MEFRCYGFGCAMGLEDEGRRTGEGEGCRLACPSPRMVLMMIEDEIGESEGAEMVGDSESHPSQP